MAGLRAPEPWVVARAGPEKQAEQPQTTSASGCALGLEQGGVAFRGPEIVVVGNAARRARAAPRHAGGCGAAAGLRDQDNMGCSRRTMSATRRRTIVDDDDLVGGERGSSRCAALRKRNTPLRGPDDRADAGRDGPHLRSAISAARASSIGGPDRMGGRRRRQEAQ